MPSVDGKAQLEVLVIDDEPHNLDIIRRHLRGRFSVLTATSGEEGLAKLREHPEVFLILCDQRMPGLSGTELLSLACQEAPLAQRVLMTAYADQATLADAINLGRVSRYVPKPIGAGVLEQVIEAALEAREHQQGGQDAAHQAELQALSAVLEHDAFSLAYQPVFTTRVRSVFGYEALCRPDRAHFDGPLALVRSCLHHGRIGQLGIRIRQVAIAALDQLPPDAVLFINTHPDELFEPALGEFAESLGPLANRVVLEVTESAALTDYRVARDAVSRLQQRGLCIALDDFGSGYSGINHLAQLSPDFVKLDRVLVQGLGEGGSAARLVSHIVEFSHGEGISVIAEGIETEQELQRIASLGCDMAQGFHLARPGPLPERP